MMSVPSRHGRGAVIIPRSMESRYIGFDLSLDRLWVPEGTYKVPGIGVNPAQNRNQAIDAMLANPDGGPEAEWFYLQDDDHEVPPSTLIQLLDRDLPVVSAFICSKQAPQVPVVFKARTKDPRTSKLKFQPYRWEDFDGVHGVFQIAPEGAVGAAALLIRRDALLKLERPFFRVGQYEPDELHEDIWLCDQLQKAGVPVYVDLDAPIGHLANVASWPHRLADGRWSVKLSWLDGANVVMGRL